MVGSRPAAAIGFLFLSKTLTHAPSSIRKFSAVCLQCPSWISVWNRIRGRYRSAGALADPNPVDVGRELPQTGLPGPSLWNPSVEYELSRPARYWGIVAVNSADELVINIEIDPIALPIELVVMELRPPIESPEPVQNTFAQGYVVCSLMWRRRNMTSGEIPPLPLRQRGYLDSHGREKKILDFPDVFRRFSSYYGESQK